MEWQLKGIDVKKKKQIRSQSLHLERIMTKKSFSIEGHGPAT